jgi:predicted RNA binding protein YcfA (HicA-like mRNA interferase family)
MSKLPSLTARQIFKALERLGFTKVRQEGSHAFFRHPDGRTTVIPVHPGETIDRGLLNKIIKKDLGVDREDFLQHL